MKFKSNFIRWIVGFIINALLCLLFFFILNTWQGWDFQGSILVASLIQMVLIVPTYVKEVKIIPQGAPTQLRGMTANDYNGNTDYMGIKKFPFDNKDDRDISGIKWYVLKRTVMQQLSYFIVMMGIGVYLVFIR